jgi:hypothetical protein
MSRTVIHKTPVDARELAMAHAEQYREKHSQLVPMPNGARTTILVKPTDPRYIAYREQQSEKIQQEIKAYEAEKNHRRRRAGRPLKKENPSADNS